MIDVRVQFPGLVEALIKVESADKNHPDGNDEAIGDKGLTHPAYGPLQIRQPYVDDFNRAYQTKHTAQDCLDNRELSIDILNGYMWIYAAPRYLGHSRSAQDIARIHNGGPAGFKHDATLGYWEKVKKFYTA